MTGDKVFTPDEFHCSFCGVVRRQVKKLLSGPRVFICDNCIATCVDLLAKKYPRDPETGVRAGTKSSCAQACSFCRLHEARVLIAGPEVYICEDCVDLGVRAIEVDSGKD
jgi:ATP-dependent protease Clp ATPase subunit